MKKSALLSSILFVLGLAVLCGSSWASTYYVSPSGGSSASGTRSDPWSLSKANAALRAGDTAVLQAGVYDNARIYPDRDGADGAPIVYRSDAPLAARLTYGDPVINVQSRRYITIDGVYAEPENGRFVRGAWSRDIVIQNCKMEGAKNAYNVIDFANTKRLRFLNNDCSRHMRQYGLRLAGDLLRVTESEDALVEGNRIGKAGHGPAAFRWSKRLVIRNNVFYGLWGRVGTFAGLERSLIENNVITGAMNSGGSAGSAAKVLIVDSIFRRNLVVKNWNGPLSCYPYQPEDAPHFRVERSRLYNNTLCYNATHAWSAGVDSYFNDNIWMNNLFYYNDYAGDWDAFNMHETDGTNNVVAYNVFCGDVPGRDTTPDHPAFGFNYDVVPKFLDPQRDDYRLAAGSPCIDLAEFLTRARSGGSGTSIPVDDARWFFDGFGVAGEEGDMVFVGPAKRAARVVSADITNDVLTVDRSISWSSGDTVTLAYKGAAPDMGCMEHGAEGEAWFERVTVPPDTCWEPPPYPEPLVVSDFEEDTLEQWAFYWNVDRVRDTYHSWRADTAAAGQRCMEVRATNDNAELEVFIEPYLWDIDAYPFLRFAYRIPPGVGMGMRAIDFDGDEHTLGAAPDFGYRGRNDLIADDAWHWITIDVRAYFPPETRYLRGIIFTGRDVLDGDRYWIDEFFILPALPVPLGSDADDAEQRVGSGSVSLHSSDLEMVHDPAYSDEQLVGLRFPGIAVPQGALITGATLEFRTHAADTGACSLRIEGEAADDAAPFAASAGNLSARARTAAHADWTVPGWQTIGKQRASPDLAPVLQELVDRPGWQSGNAAAFLISGSGRRVATSRDTDPARAPVLHVRYRLRAFKAYDDTGWEGQDNRTGITTFSRDSGGALMDHATRSRVRARLDISDGGAGPNAHGADAAPGTDAHDVFNGIVDCFGLLSYGSDLQLTFSELEPGLEYNVVLFGNRDMSSYTDRFTRFTIGSADSFVNASSAGASYSGTDDPSVRIRNGWNRNEGYVARFRAIAAGPDNAFEVTVSDGGSAEPPRFYLNALMLEATVPADTSVPVPRRSVWRFEDSGTDLGTSWRSGSYDDSQWKEGRGVLGYGETYINTELAYGADAQHKDITRYFRRLFFLAQLPGAGSQLLLYARYDDGIVVYLNGAEVARRFLPTGQIQYDTTATSHEDAGYETIDLTAHLDKLMAGRNVLAVEVHQSGPTSPDVVMDMELVLTAGQGAPQIVAISRGALWRYRKGTAEASYPPAAWRRAPGRYDDAGWQSGATPVGYGPLSYGTVLSDMQDGYTCVFLRKTFTLSNPATVAELALQIDHDDGFIAWVNEEEVARVNVAGPAGNAATYTAVASGYVPSAGDTWSTTLSGGALPVLQNDNVLAIQLFNHSIGSGDALLDAELSCVCSQLSAQQDPDHDALPDAWETAELNGTGQDGDDDNDNDGTSNMQEYVAGTDPDDPDEYLALDVTLAGGAARVSFPTIPCQGPGYTGRTRCYTLQKRPGILASWLPVPGYERIEATGQAVTYNNAGDDSALFRARVWLE